MKKFFTSIVICITFYANSQTTIIDSIYVGGIYRNYRLYVPAIYNGTTARPLVLNLHGYTSNAYQQQLYSNFMPIADTANFLMVLPNGTFSGTYQYWNAGIISSGVNDIAFLSALIDSIDLTYNVDLNRVYSTGMSNGGFMSHTLACELSHRITAIASVTGSIFTTQYGTNCHPTHPMPVMQIHGTADGTVPFIGSTTMAPIDSVIRYWVRYNNCNFTPTFINVPNISLTDGCTAERYLYSNGNSGSTVELYKIIGGTHSWPGFPFGGVGTNLDINASKEIWRFFNKYKLNTLTSVSTLNKPQNEIELYPNPSNDVISIKFNTEIPVNYNVQIKDVLGKIIQIESNSPNTMAVTNLPSGIYFLEIVSSKKIVLTQKFIKN